MLCGSDTSFCSNSRSPARDLCCSRNHAGHLQEPVCTFDWVCLRIWMSAFPGPCFTIELLTGRGLLFGLPDQASSQGRPSSNCLEWQWPSPSLQLQELPKPPMLYTQRGRSCLSTKNSAAGACDRHTATSAKLLEMAQMIAVSARVLTTCSCNRQPGLRSIQKQAAYGAFSSLAEVDH